MFQLNLVFKKRSFLFAFSAALLFSVLSFVLACFNYYGHEINEIPSAEKLFLWGSDSDAVFLMLYYIMPVLCVLPFADSFITENERNMLPVFLPRVGVKKYLSGKLLAVAVSAATISHPYLLCLISVILTGIFCALMAVLSCELSFFFCRSRV